MAFIGQTIAPISTPDIVAKDIPCDASIAVGDWVRIDATSTAVKALADTADNAHVMGIVEEKATSTLCYIRLAGISKVVFAGLDPTKEYFLSPTTAGSMTTTVPVGAGEILLRVGKAMDSTRIVVAIGTRIGRAL